MKGTAIQGRWTAAAITVGAVLVGLAVVFDLGALRTVFAVAICLVLPGLGWARRFRTRDRGDTLALALVLSICTTVVVATAMVVTAHWSLVGGLSALVVVGAAGFVPWQRVSQALHIALPLRPAAAGRSHDPEWVDWYRRRRAHASAEQEQAATEWVDWYAGARRRAAEDRARTRALQREADAQWADWFRTAHPERAAKLAGRDGTEADQSTSSKTAPRP